MGGRGRGGRRQGARDRSRGVNAASRLGNETLDRARSVTGKPSSRIAGRVLRRRGEDEERDEEG
jgi:hypothetical protein